MDLCCEKIANEGNLWTSILWSLKLNVLKWIGEYAGNCEIMPQLSYAFSGLSH